MNLDAILAVVIVSRTTTATEGFKIEIAAPIAWVDPTGDEEPVVKLVDVDGLSLFLIFGEISVKLFCK